MCNVTLAFGILTRISIKELRKRYAEFITSRGILISDVNMN